MIFNVTAGISEFRRFSLIIMCLIFVSSCRTVKNVPYFENIPEDLDEPLALKMASYVPPKIQAQDILQISIKTLNPANTAMLEASAASIHSPESDKFAGYLVDSDGKIELPLVGKISVAGLTTSEAQDSVRARAAMYYKEPIVNIRIANFTVTILGEVTRPGQYVVPNERMTIIDALGLAGDLTIYGRRENVMLIRETNGEKNFIRYNLNHTDIFKGSNFYLRQNDVIYVEPAKNKVAATDVTTVRNISLITSITSVVVLAVSRIIL